MRGVVGAARALMFGIDPDSILAMSGPALYIGIFLLPFIQEDAAVIAAATASISGMGPVAAIFAVILVGLTASDIWKYWIGYAGRSNKWARRFAEKPGVSVAGDLVRTELAKTLFVARFVPGTRIPTYLACGFFRVAYIKFVGIVMVTALCYVTISFTLFHTVGAVAGEHAKFWLPAIAVAIVGSYILFRWLRHRNNREGPMTPMSREFDHPVPELADTKGTPHKSGGANSTPQK